MSVLLSAILLGQAAEAASGAAGTAPAATGAGPAATGPAATGAAGAAMNQPTMGQALMSSLPYMLLFGAIFYFLILRPQQRKQKEHEERLRKIKVGDRVKTIAGLLGDVISVKTDTFVIKIAEGVKVEFDRNAIVSIVEAAAPSEAEAAKEDRSKDKVKFK